MKRNRVGFNYAIRGIFTALQTEYNMKIHFVVMFVTLFAGLYFQLSVFEWLFVLIAIGFVLAFELMNTAIELVTNQLFPGQHEDAKRIKDISAASVLIAAVFAAIVGTIIFAPKVINLIS
ncbi:diacylglycerol kinase [Halalkalibacillus sediminis]|uniref:Diacylglycerol kinase n=1 Tax=Halalkalibacillus sediminis TaxID=2018042 RepID=A0A2I0QXH5_9BACI|nr:diacylglycerol kinase family protein [Halalkalibacillus sediminis]PKR79024.1 diacylglycerol kinase [Halalkalibacillus sediminis]